MSALKRDSVPPPRPPAPKGITKRSSSNNSIKKSFKLLEEDEEDEEDLTILTGEFEKKLDKVKPESTLMKADSPRETTPVKVSKVETKSMGLNPRSKSFDDDKSTINVARIKQNFVDISSGFKEKIAKKWEEISSEINPNETDELEKSEIDPTNSDKLQQDLKNAERKRKDVDDKVIVNDENKSVIDKISGSENSQENTPVKKKVLPPAKLSQTPEELENAAFAIVEEYYSTEPKEDFTGMPQIPQSNSYGEFPRQRSGIRKLIRSKNTKPATAPATPVSMSKLLTKKEEMEEEESKSSKSEDLSLGSNNRDSSNGTGSKTSSGITAKAVKDTMVVPVKKLSVGALILFLYLILPLPSYISGMVLGMFISSVGWGLYIWLTKPAAPKPTLERVPISQLPPMELPEMKDIVTEDGVYKGWMNEIPSYTPEKYHINQTHSVYIDLEGTTLRLRRPKANIPKRAMWDEGQIPIPPFIHQRHLNLEGSKIFLLPPGLVKKRIWSKKYPICIALAQSSITIDQTPDSENDFEVVTEQKCSDSILFLFARTCREKEDWYKRFTAAAKGQPLPSHLGQIRKCFSSKSKQYERHGSSTSLESSFQHKRQGSTDSTSSTGSSSPMREAEENINKQTLESFIRYMARLMPRELYDTRSSPTHKHTPWDCRGPVDCDDSIIWLNAIISRLFWDFLHNNYFKDKVLEKLQRKLGKIHIPYFIEELKITNIDLGDEMPMIRRGNRPYLDEQGFWVDIDVNYDGGFQMTIETKVNLMRLKQTSDKPESSSQRSAITNSDEEDSAESSSDEEEESGSPGVEEGSASGGRASRKILRYLGKITQSKYFQSATEIKYIKKKMEEVSNTPLVLTVEVRILSGTLTINVPPPPTDRLWYGFRGNPKLQLVAKPKVGAREVNVTHLTEWIEKKLSTEFQRVLVMPNMDDLTIPILLCDHIKDAVPIQSPSGSEV